MVSVGIIVNPTAGKDIRRLVGQALVIGNREKVNIVKRVLIGIYSTGVRKVYFMPDRLGIGRQCLADLKFKYPDISNSVEVLDMTIDDSAVDTVRAAASFRDLQTRAIITLGGDGTVRAAAKGAGDVPILPISTGTNNVLPSFIEGTIAGMAVGKFALLSVEECLKFVLQQKKIEIFINGIMKDITLVDLVMLSGMHFGSRAVWKAENLRQIAVTRASAASIGLSSIIAGVQSILPDEPIGGTALISNSDDGEQVTNEISGISGFSVVNYYRLSPTIYYDFFPFGLGRNILVISESQNIPGNGTSLLGSNK